MDTEKRCSGWFCRTAWFICALWMTIGVAHTEEAHVLVKGHPAHPTRLLAKYKQAHLGKARVAAGGLNLPDVVVRDQFQLVPGLVVLDEAVGVAARVAANQKPLDAKAQAVALRERIDTLKNSGLFDYVEPDYLVYLDATPTDAAFADGTLWGLRNTGQSGGVAGADIGAVQAWDITTGSPDVIVAIIDSGVRYTHRDLAANMWRNPGEIPGNGIDDDGDGYVDNVFGIDAVNNDGDPMDDNGHGTHVAGTIGAAANDGNQHVGVAWNIRLMACKAGDANGSLKVSDQIKCIDFATAKGARIMNASFGGSGESQAQFEAIRRAGDRGVLFVAAAGNEANNNDLRPAFPASHPLGNIISVAAIDRANQLASFSNYGQTKVHLGAPGVSVFSCGIESDTSYTLKGGTSMATPHVAGVAALVLSHYPGMSVGDLRQSILNGVVPVSALQGKTITGGRVNALNALNAVADGTLEIAVQPPAGSTLLAGSTLALVVSVSDLGGVNNASVTGNIAGSTNLAFNNAGTAPDAVAGDENYSALVTVSPFTTALTVNLVAAAPGKTGTNVTVAYEVIPPVVNDAFSKRTILSSVTNLTVTGSNLRATKEPGEPNHIGHTNVTAGGKSVWWSWTAPISGVASIGAEGSEFDTLLAVYTGTSVSALTPVASNDDWLSQYPESFVTFDAVAGTTYQIAVDGFGAASGTIRLQVVLAPPQATPVNDNFQNRGTLPNQPSGGNYVSSGTAVTFGATKQSGEPFHAGNKGGRSVWFTWTAPADGIVDLTSDGANFDTLLAVYTGTSVLALTPVASNDDEGSGITTSRVSFFTLSGTTYQIAIDGFNGAVGVAPLSLTLAPVTPTADNDNFVNASQLSGSSVSVTGSSIGASKEYGEPNHANNAGGRSKWWDWTAPANGVCTISTAGSSFDTLLAVYTGTALNALSLIASNDDSSFGGSRVVFYAFSGTTYRIAVDGYRSWFGSAASGSIVLNLTLDTGVRPVNDNFANRITLSGAVVSTNGSNVAGTKETGEPAHAGNSGGRSVWWTWTAPLTGYVDVTTAGSNFDTLLAIYQGSTIAALTLVEENDQAPEGGTSSSLTFFAIQGIEYHFAVDGRSGTSGNIALDVSQLSRITGGYYTGFEAEEGYSLGQPLAGQPTTGQDHWEKVGTGGAGLVTNVFAGSGHQAYVGFFSPQSSGESDQLVWAPLEYTPLPNETITFMTKLRIINSSNGRYDYFKWRVVNRSGNRLFTLGFDNSSKRAYYTLDDDSFVWTDFYFNNTSIYQLAIGLDFTNNRWIATVNGSTIVSFVPLTKLNSPLDLGYVGASWGIAVPGSPGDNWMAFDDYGVLGIEKLFAPGISNQPISLSVTAGTSTNLTVTATGTPALSYQWYRDGVAIPGAAFATLSLPNVQTNQAGRYTVVVTNVIGSVTSVEAVVLVHPLISPPSNDNFANRIAVTGSSNVVFGVNAVATKEAGEPAHAGNIGGKSVWWSWTAPSAGQFIVNTAGSDFDTLLAVYTGSDIANLASIASSDDFQSQIRNAAVLLNAAAGTTYQIAVDGYNGDSGNVRLTLKPLTSLAFRQPAKLLNGAFQTEFAGEPGVRYWIQASTNLINWSTVATVIGQDEVLDYFDAQATNAPARFYRALQEP